MSVLNQSGEEQVECPLCMEPLEVDDLNFFPCTCGYQICRFCWHRIRTDENGLCPACRKAYSENPADFTPLSKEQVAQLKAEKRQRDQQRKAKLSESRKHLANVRVVQKNLVFVVGLPMRLADPEILKRHEYFGKFGKIHKVVINQSTSYAGSQGPSASAYVTYMKSDDALRAIQSVNNITIDGRLVKSSLGTTKYCSHFMKNQSCPKPDCMYLHDFGDPEASFTKEQMHAGKHQEYEKKLHDVLIAKLAMQGDGSSGGKTQQKSKDTAMNNNNNKEGWPQLNNVQSGLTISGEKGSKSDKVSDAVVGKEKGQKSRGKFRNHNYNESRKDKGKGCESGTFHGQNNESHGKNFVKNKPLERDRQNGRSDEKSENLDKIHSSSRETSEGRDSSASSISNYSGGEKSHLAAKLQIVNENSSFFSQNAFQKLSPTESEHSDVMAEEDDENSRESQDICGGHYSSTSHILNDSFPNINSSEDWEAAFGFAYKMADSVDNRRENDSFVGFLGEQRQDLFGVHRDPPSLTTTPHNSFNTNKLHESILDVLNNSSFSKPEDRLGIEGLQQHQQHSNPHPQPHLSYGPSNSLNGTTNGLDQQMSKFFTDFCMKNGNQNCLPNNFVNAPPNGLPVHHQPQSSNNSFLLTLADQHNMLVAQQKQIEYQIRSFKQQVFEQQMLSQQHQQQPFLNNDVLGSGTILHPSYHPFYNQHNNSHHSTNLNSENRSGKQQTEDELDFDPFHETQKALAELIENEQNGKGHMDSRSNMSSTQINGLIHSQNGNNGHLPPPPGFVQPTNHMNSFGSKILPFLNMNSNQQINGNTTHSNWSGNFNQVQQQKNLGNCNDWKVLDPAIVSSSRHYPLANMHVREQYNGPLLQQQNGHGAGPIRPFDYPLKNFSHVQQNLNWLAGNSADLGSQLSSPPGFRTPAATAGVAKAQQEC